MAFVPDEAVNRFHELTPKAALLFVYYCKRRGAADGMAWPSLSTIAKDMAIPKSSACELRKQLFDRGWIQVVSGDNVRVVMGFPLFEKAEPDSEKSNDVRKSRMGRSEKSNESFGKVKLHIRNNQPNEPIKEIHVESADSTARQVKTIFSYWQERLNHPNSKLTAERQRKIEARLREGYTIGQIKQAIDGCASSSFHRGENDQRRSYDDLELICRNGSKLETFIALAAPRKGSGYHSSGATSPKNQFCGQCDHGYLPLRPDDSKARYCLCVSRKEVRV